MSEICTELLEAEMREEGVGSRGPGVFSSISERWDFRQKKERKREWPQSLGGRDRKMAPSSNQPGLHS